MTEKLILLSIRKADFAPFEIISCNEEDGENLLIGERWGDDLTYAFLCRCVASDADRIATEMAQRMGLAVRILPLS